MLIFIPGRVVSNFIMQALEGKPLTVRLCDIYSRDNVKTLIASMKG